MITTIVESRTRIEKYGRAEKMKRAFLANLFSSTFSVAFDLPSLCFFLCSHLYVSWSSHNKTILVFTGQKVSLWRGRLRKGAEVARKRGRAFLPFFFFSVFSFALYIKLKQLKFMTTIHGFLTRCIRGKGILYSLLLD